MTAGERPHVLAPVCVNHRKRETWVRCGKCGDPICPKCMIQTPVGVRCKECAQVRRLPQYDVPIWILARSALGGLAASVFTWAVVSYVPYLRFFLSIFVGVAVAEVMSRLARRRDNRALEIAAVLAIGVGFFLTEFFVGGYDVAGFVALLSQSPGFFISLAAPIAIASFIAVVKLR